MVLELWLVHSVRDKRLVGKRMAGTFARVGLDDEEQAKETLVLSVKKS